MSSDRLVLETLTPLSGDRKCFRLINGVLMERTVSDVLPVLQTNADGLKKVLEDLVKQYRSKQEEMEKWKVSLICIARCAREPPLTNYSTEKEQSTSCAAMRDATMLWLQVAYQVTMIISDSRPRCNSETSNQVREQRRLAA